MKHCWTLPFFLILMFLPTLFPSLGEAEDTLKLSALIEEALEANPNIAAAKAAWEAQKVQIDRVKILDDPEVGFDTWNIPNTLDLSLTRNWIFFAKQRFPAAGTLKQRSEAAKTVATLAKTQISITSQSIVAQVKIAYDALYLAHKAMEVNAEHIDITKRFEEIAEIKYQTGAVSEQYVLKARVILARLENEQVTRKQRLHTARAVLNTLLRRPPRSPLARPTDLRLLNLPADLVALTSLALRERPELLAAKAAIQRSKQETALARLKLKPDYQVSVKRFQNRGTPQPSGWGVSASINLPWFFHEKHDQRIQETRHRSTEQEALYENLKDQTRFVIEDLIVKIQTAGRLAALFQDNVIPQAEQSVTSAQTGYQTDQVDFLDLLDSQRQLVDFRLEYFRALTLQNQEVARLEQVLGSDLSNLKNTTNGEIK